MWLTAGRNIVRFYSVLFMTAVGGLVAGAFFVPENSATYVAPWAHGGWYAGTALALFGAVSGRLRFINGATVPASPASPGPAPDPPRTTTPTAQTGSLIGNALGLGLVGAFLGTMFGGSLLVFWLSLASSPFAPRSVVSSVTLASERAPGSARERPIYRVDHPVVVYLFAVPTAAGGLVRMAGGAATTLWRRPGPAEPSGKDESPRSTG